MSRSLLWLVPLLFLAACLRLTDKEGAWRCTEDSQCPSGDHCVKRECVPEGVCARHSDCDADQRCDRALCVTAECAKVDDCAPFLCDIEERLCFNGCEASGCAEGFACNDDACHPACRSSADCDGRACYPSGVCGKGKACSSDTDCGGYRCMKGECTTECLDDDNECDLGFACQGRKCVSAPCSDDSMCSPYRCTEHRVCTTECSSDKDCKQEGAYCDVQGPPLPGSCTATIAAGSACVFDRECTSKRCLNRICTGTGLLHSACTKDTDCLSSACIGGECLRSNLTTGSTCLEARQCQSHLCSLSGQCTIYSKGSRCTEHVQCSSGFCSNNYCL